MNGRNFLNIEQYENIPLTRLSMMVNIHIESVEAERKAWESGSK